VVTEPLLERGCGDAFTTGVSLGEKRGCRRGEGSAEDEVCSKRASSQPSCPKKGGPSVERGRCLPEISERPLISSIRGEV